MTDLEIIAGCMFFMQVIQWMYLRWIYLELFEQHNPSANRG